MCHILIFNLDSPTEMEVLGVLQHLILLLHIMKCLGIVVTLLPILINVYAIHSKVAVEDRSEDSACFAAVSVNSTFSSVDSKSDIRHQPSLNELDINILFCLTF